MGMGRMCDIIASIDDAIECRKKLVKTGFKPPAWNHFPHGEEDYEDNRLRSEMNGLEVAKWILGGKIGKPRKWG